MNFKLNTNDPFETHEIDHLSPSSINTFIQNKEVWIMRYLFKYRNGGSPAMWRGTVVDHAIGSLLFENREEEAILESSKKEFVNHYEKCLKDYPDQVIEPSQVLKEQTALPKYLRTAFDFYKTLGKPTDYQKKVEYFTEEVPIPIIGYIDLQYENIIRDIKTTGRMPSEVSSAHARQLSVYAKAEDCMPVLDYVYVTTKKAEVVTLRVTDVDKHIKEVEKVALAIMRLLSYSNDKYEIANLSYPDYDSWMWSDQEKQFARTIWS
tara:strand:+ start:2709 stop:3500 length:792 start_codon:yes stop_codon:yes gene_type:complete